MTKKKDEHTDKASDVATEESQETATNNHGEPSEQAEEKKASGWGSRKKSSKKLEEQTKELNAQLGELKDKYLRLFAEFDNYKKRTIKEKLELMSTASQDIIQALLPILDDFDRAKKSADDPDTDEAFSDGVTMVYNRLYATLESKGLKPMDTDQAVFNPDLHDAITEIPAASEDLKGKIVDTIEKGYYLNDKIIRHAKVVVGK